MAVLGVRALGLGVRSAGGVGCDRCWAEGVDEGGDWTRAAVGVKVGREGALDVGGAVAGVDGVVSAGLEAGAGVAGVEGAGFRAQVEVSRAQMAEGLPLTGGEGEGGEGAGATGGAVRCWELAAPLAAWDAAVGAGAEDEAEAAEAVGGGRGEREEEALRGGLFVSSTDATGSFARGLSAVGRSFSPLAGGGTGEVGKEEVGGLEVGAEAVVRRG